MKAHDIFPGVCYPDYFWEQARDNLEGEWYLMCPHEILKKKDMHWKILLEKNGRKNISIVWRIRRSKRESFRSRM